MGESLFLSERDAITSRSNEVIGTPTVIASRTKSRRLSRMRAFDSRVRPKRNPRRNPRRTRTRTTQRRSQARRTPAMRRRLRRARPMTPHRRKNQDQRRYNRLHQPSSKGTPCLLGSVLMAPEFLQWQDRACAIAHCLPPYSLLTWGFGKCRCIWGCPGADWGGIQTRAWQDFWTNSYGTRAKRRRHQSPLSCIVGVTGTLILTLRSHGSRGALRTGRLTHRFSEDSVQRDVRTREVWRKGDG